MPDDWGPNGDVLRSFIDRVGRLAPEEADALADAFNGFGVAYDTAADVGLAQRRKGYNAARRCAPKGLPGDARLAIMNAAGAIVVRDLISEQDFLELYGPWAEVIEGAARVAKREPEAVREADAAVMEMVGPWRPPSAPNAALAVYSWPLEDWRQWDWGLPDEVPAEAVAKREVKSLERRLRDADDSGALPDVAPIVFDEAIEKGYVGIACAALPGLLDAPRRFYTAVAALFRPMPYWEFISPDIAGDVIGETIAGPDALTGITERNWETRGNYHQGEARSRALAVLGRFAYLTGQWQAALDTWSEARDAFEVDTVLVDIAQNIDENHDDAREVVAGLLSMINGSEHRADAEGWLLRRHWPPFMHLKE